MNETLQKVQLLGNEVQLLSKENTKYGFGSETRISKNATTLHRIVALRDIVNPEGRIIARKGDKGGFIEKESNLDYQSGAWVRDNAQVFDDARVYDNAVVSDDAWVYDRARVHDYAWLHDNPEVYGDVEVCGDAEVYGHVHVSGKTKMTTGKLGQFDVDSTKALEICLHRIAETNKKLAALKDNNAMRK